MPRERCQGDPADEPRSGLGLRDHRRRHGAQGAHDRLRPAQHRLQGRELLRLVRQPDGRQAHGSGRQGRDDGQGPARGRARSRSSRTSTAARPTTTRSSSSRATRASSIRSSRAARPRRARTRACRQWDNQKARTIFEQMLVQTSQQDRRRRRGERRARERRRHRAEGEEAEADPALRAGRDGSGRAEHHLGLAVRDGVQARQDRGATRRPPSRSR